MRLFLMNSREHQKTKQYEQEEVAFTPKGSVPSGLLGGGNMRCVITINHYLSTDPLSFSFPAIRSSEK